jgi:hypothetical protein
LRWGLEKFYHKTGGMAQVVGHLPSKYEALNSQYHLEREREREKVALAGLEL